MLRFGSFGIVWTSKRQQQNRGTQGIVEEPNGCALKKVIGANVAGSLEIQEEELCIVAGNLLLYRNPRLYLNDVTRILDSLTSYYRICSNFSASLIASLKANHIFGVRKDAMCKNFCGVLRLGFIIYTEEVTSPEDYYKGSQ